MKKQLSYDCTQKIYNILCGLAYRIADNAYIIERYGVKGSAIERKENHATICGLFDELDACGVPFWVQNNAIAFGDDWRRYKTEFLKNWLVARGVNCDAVTVF